MQPRPEAVGLKHVVLDVRAARTQNWYPHRSGQSPDPYHKQNRRRQYWRRARKHRNTERKGIGITICVIGHVGIHRSACSKLVTGITPAINETDCTPQRW